MCDLVSPLVKQFLLPNPNNGFRVMVIIVYSTFSAYIVRNKVNFLEFMQVKLFIIYSVYSDVISDFKLNKNDRCIVMEDQKYYCTMQISRQVKP